MKTAKMLGIALGTMGLAGQAMAIALNVAPDKTDPLYQSKGDQKRMYKFPETGEKIPYRIYVPTIWAPGKSLPLVVVLHGGGLDENAPFERSPAPLKNELQKMAEEFGYIIVSPIGYNLSGGFGAPPPPGLGGPGGPPRPAGVGGTGAPGARPAGGTPVMTSSDPKTREYSVEDVMNVVSIVEKEYGVDPAKEFLTGNSMGGIGTMFLAAKFPDKWLAIAPSEAGFDPARYGKDKYGAKGALFIHKQDDKAPQVETETAEMIKIFAGQGIDARTIAVPNSVHENAWFLSLPVTFHFFDKFVQAK